MQDNVPKLPEIGKLMREDLKRSGLTEKDIKVRPLTRTQNKNLTGIELIGYQIVYCDIKNKATKYTRVRLLEEKDLKGTFGNQAKNKKPFRYVQPEGTGCSFYLPSCIDWGKVVKDTTIPIYITEGEKKAAKACKEGYTTIGLGGVESFSKNGKLIEDFKWFDWSNRDIYIIYDSDQHNNINVQRAQNRITKEFAKLGAHAHIVILPDSSEGEKQGLDDFIVVKGKRGLEKLIVNAEEPESAEALFSMNEKFAVLRNPPRILELKEGNMYTARDFIGTLCANKKHVEIVIKKNKNGDLVPDKKEVSTAKKWVEWEYRSEFKSICYEPGYLEVVDDYYNTWRPSRMQKLGDEVVKLKRGALNLYFEFRDYIMSSEPEHIKWLEQWIAYPIQYPGVKMNSAVLFRSDSQGVGKSLMGEIIGRLYGNNFGVVTHNKIYRDFTQWAEGKQFILGDEVSGTDKRAETDKLKNLITNNTIEINKKHVPEYDVKDHINYWFTSNHVDAVYLEGSDRRFFIVDMGHKKPLSDEFYRKIDKWYKSDAVADLYYYLKHKVDTSKFNPNAQAPQTKSKESMIHYSRSATEQFVTALNKDTDILTRVTTAKGDIDLPGDLLTASDICERYTHLYPDLTRISPTAVGKAMTKTGFVQRHLTNKGIRLYILRNKDKWFGAADSELYKHYIEEVKKMKPPPSKHSKKKGDKDSNVVDHPTRKKVKRNKKSGKF